MSKMNLTLAGSAEIQISVSGQQILPPITDMPVCYFDFEFCAHLPCHVSVKNGPHVFIEAHQKLKLEAVELFTIQESGIPFHWLARRY